MKALSIIKEKKMKGKFKYKNMAKKLGITRQCLFHHLKNLEKGKNTFSPVQMQEICNILNEDIQIFFE